jgi:nitroimidazol reductase NimA-like FMN-containing flavoprotein (pyridoxamine 5'-phosphate oxidase superfamily)
VRHGEYIYLHGAPASRALKVVGSEAKLCFTVTQIDGLVLARSWFRHSINYRSVVILGVGRLVAEREQKLEAMRLLVDHIVPGRAEDSRWANEKELTGTSIVAMSIDAASAKLRTGGPADFEEDYALPHWAGVLPLKQVTGQPIPDDRCAVPTPGYVSGYRRPGTAGSPPVVTG